jgi:hypothetical protein
VSLQIWCYADGDAVSWVKYEAVRSQIIEHVIVTASDFDIDIYNAGAYDIDIKDNNAATATVQSDQSSHTSPHE